MKDKSQAMEGNYRGLYLLAGVAALLAMGANLLDVVLGFGETSPVTYGVRSAVEWFQVFHSGWFKGMVELGILNIVYMTCMLPVYSGLLAAHRRRQLVPVALGMTLFLLSFSVYLATNAAIPILVLAGRYAAAASEAQRAVLAAAGEAILARGEDFTPGAFPGLMLGSLAALLVSVIMLRGEVFSKANALIGLAGFSFLAAFTVIATFIPAWYQVGYFVFGMIGGLLALSWFVLTALRFFRLARDEH